MKKESFEGHVERVKGLLERLSAPEVSLEESLKLYKEGMEHIKEAFLSGADAALAASIFHFREIDIMELKHYLKSEKIEVRI